MTSIADEIRANQWNFKIDGYRVCSVNSANLPADNLPQCVKQG